MPEAASLCFADIAVGRTAKFEVVLTEDMVKRFAELSGDVNPLHMDEEYAATTQFVGRIGHGMLGASFFSQLVGMHLPGRYALYLSQQLQFKMPLRIGTCLLVRGTVVQKTEAIRTLTLRTQVLDAQTQVCLLDGEALVTVLK